MVVVRSSGNKVLFIGVGTRAIPVARLLEYATWSNPSRRRSIKLVSSNIVVFVCARTPRDGPIAASSLYRHPAMIPLPNVLSERSFAAATRLVCHRYTINYGEQVDVASLTPSNSLQIWAKFSGWKAIHGKS